MAPPGTASSSGGSVRLVEGVVNYTGDMSVRPRFYANDHSRDVLVLDPRRVQIEDARASAVAPTLAREGIVIVPHSSRVGNFRDAAEVAACHPAEIEQLLLELSGADAVSVTGAGVLRFGESRPTRGGSTIRGRRASFTSTPRMRRPRPSRSVPVPKGLRARSAVSPITTSGARSRRRRRTCHSPYAMRAPSSRAISFLPMPFSMSPGSPSGHSRGSWSGSIRATAGSISPACRARRSSSSRPTIPRRTSLARFRTARSMIPPVRPECRRAAV
jgi:hypothetical protein